VAGKHFKKKKSNILSMLLLVIFMAIFIYSLSTIIYWLNSNNELEKIEEEVIDRVATINKEEESSQKGSVTVDFNRLEQINEDIEAWIYIKNTDINYPVLQTSDNEYYLKRDIYKKYSSCGSIFFDCNSKIDFSDDNTIIYGHNLKNKKMFADLSKIYKGELGDSIEIEIYTKDMYKKYQVITAYMEEPNLDIIQRNFNNDEMGKYISKNILKSKTKFNYNSSETKKLLTLVTCDSTGKERIVVTAVEI